MKHFAIVAVLMMSAALRAEVKPPGTVVPFLCGHQNKSEYVCLNSVVGSSRLVLSLARFHGATTYVNVKQVLPSGPGLQTYLGHSVSEPMGQLVEYRFQVKRAYNGNTTGQLTINGRTRNDFPMEHVAHTQDLE